MTIIKTKIDTEAIEVPYAKLVAPDDNVRTDLTDIEDLAQSIATVGLLTPIQVRPLNGSGKYEIVSGFRRHAALGRLVEAKQWAGPVPVLVKERADDNRLVAMLVENLQRVDLNPADEAFGMQRLAVDFTYSAKEIAEMLVRPLQFVKDRLSLCTLPDAAIAQLRAGTLSIEAAVALTKAPAAIHDKLLTNPKLTPDTIKYAAEEHRTKELGKKIRELLKNAGVKIDPKLSTYNTPTGYRRLGEETITSQKQAESFIAALPITPDCTFAAVGTPYAGRVTVVLFVPTGIKPPAEGEPAPFVTPTADTSSFSPEVQEWFVKAAEAIDQHDAASAEWVPVQYAERVSFLRSMSAKDVASAALMRLALDYASAIASEASYQSGHERALRKIEDMQLDLTLETATREACVTACTSSAKMIARAAAFQLDRFYHLNDSIAEHFEARGLKAPTMEIPALPPEIEAALAPGDGDDDDDHNFSYADIEGHGDLVYIAGELRRHMEATK